MTKEEIVGGLKNAMERGYSMEQAVQSFINSGYNPDEVREAANIVTQGGVSSIINSAVTAQAISLEQAPLFTEEGVPQPPQEMLAATPSAGSVTAAEVGKAKPKKRGLIIALVVLLAVLAGSIIALTLFRDQIIKLISSIF